MTSGDDDTEKGIFRFAPPIFLAGGSLMLGRAFSSGWNDQGFLFGCVGLVCVMLWHRLDRYHRMSSQLTQLQGVMTTTLAVTRAAKNARGKIPRRVTLLGRSRV